MEFRISNPSSSVRHRRREQDRATPVGAVRRRREHRLVRIGVVHCDRHTGAIAQVPG